VSQIVWRIATDTPTYTAEDLGGEGAKMTGGRWNAAGAPVVYGSEHIATACLETLVHLNDGGLPYNRYLVAIEIPDEVWTRAQRETPSSLPIGWDAEPAGRDSISFGMTWLATKAAAILVIPSVIIPEESNILINPIHADAATIRSAKQRKWLYDPRFARASPA